ncbi:CoA transferase [Streptomyces diastatochromogenes]|nr:CoA transferase [Streptomyces diastatochromogenes]
MAGPLTGVRVLEFAGSAPTAFVGTVLSGLGADVVRVDRAPATGGRPAPEDGRPGEPALRGRRSVALDLKSPEGIERALALAEHADLLVEGFRPGVADRLGIGPGAALARNPRLVYGRLSGWGGEGEWAGRAAHDLAVLALTGALDTDPATGAPVPPRPRTSPASPAAPTPMSTGCSPRSTSGSARAGARSSTPPSRTAPP